APAAKTVLPEESEGSIARPVTRPAPPEAEPSSPPELVPIAAGPTAVQVPLEVAFDWPSVKRRKLAPMVSVPGSPNPVGGAGFAKLSVQPLMVPVRPVVELFWIVSTQVPWALAPAKADSGCCGLNVAKNGALPFWIGVPALSSKTVLVKLAGLIPWPTLVK